LAQVFDAVCRKFLPTYGASFAAFWREFCHVLPFYVKFLKRSTKVCCIFLGVCVCKSLSMGSLLLSKITLDEQYFP